MINAQKRAELLAKDDKRRKNVVWRDPHLLCEVEEVVGLVDEEDLQSGASEVVPAQVDLSDLRQRPFKVLSYTCEKTL